MDSDDHQNRDHNHLQKNYNFHRQNLNCPPTGFSAVPGQQRAGQLPKIPRQLAQQSGADDEGDDDDDDDDDDDGEDGEDGDDDDDDGDDNDFIRNTIEKGLNIKSFIVINDDYIFIQSESFLLARLAG